ncbi:MAG TPA: hypothetical protein VKR06_30370 [Ktedonosporobacter sp.]|nr:hypothetical protein [Ktedonosporobacter sp.]
MSQQEMGYGGVNTGSSESSSGYEGASRFEEPSSYGPYGQKLSGPASGQIPTAGQRLALAIVSLGMLLFLIFGLVVLAIVTSAPSWAVFPIVFVITLFTSAAVLINIAFNRRP